MRQPFRMQQEWTYRIVEGERESEETVTVELIGPRGRRETRQAKTSWSRARMRAEIAEVMGVVDDESKSVQAIDSEGRTRAEWRIAEGWKYKMVRNSEKADPQAQKGRAHGGILKMRRLDTREDLEVAYAAGETGGETGGDTWKALEERGDRR
jgi:hypothetical protein